MLQPLSQIKHDTFNATVRNAVHELDGTTVGISSTEQMKDFDKAFSSDPNLKFCTRYMNMVQILLDAIQA